VARVRCLTATNTQSRVHVVACLIAARTARQGLLTVSEKYNS
jgi:hypothetical protein